jgi:uncharacterized membrane protein YdjX (TVP38/TMEM64 family)
MRKSNLLSIISFVLFSVLPLFSTSVLTIFLINNQNLFQSFSTIQWVFVSFILTFAAAFALCPPTFLAIVYGYFLGYFAIVHLFFINFGAIFLVYFLYKILKFSWVNQYFSNHKTASNVLLKLKKEELKIIFFAKLSPVLPFALTNLLFAVSGAKLKNILIGGFLGMVPRTLLAIYTGSQANEIIKLIQNPNQGAMSKLFIIALVIVSFGGLIYYVKKTVFSVEINESA